MSRQPRQHGTLAMGAKDRGGCTCSPCAEAVRTYARRNAKMRAAGLVQLVDAGPARDHLTALLRAGLEVHEIEKRSGVHRTAIRCILGEFPGRKQSERIRPKTEAQLLAVRPVVGKAVPGATVDGTGTRRRLQALMANGWPAKELARRLGAGPNTAALQIAKRARVRGTTAAAVKRLYAELEHVEGPSHNTRGWARSRGYLPPAFWDTDTIDDPTHEPEAREYDDQGRLVRDLSAWRIDEAERLHRAGKTAVEIAELLDCTLRQARRALTKARSEEAAA